MTAQQQPVLPPILDAALAAELTGGVWQRGTPATFGRLQFDSRLLTAGEVFLALQGNADGHDYVAAAAAAGAYAAIVTREVVCDLPQLVVADSLAALHNLARWSRSKHAVEIIVVTGSNGKSTTKEMIATILATWVGQHAVLRSPGNRNNFLGLPLCLMELGVQHEYAVLEAGMNSAGEIGMLAELARPRYGLITNAGRAHLGNFTGVTEVARAKGELVGGVDLGGTVILNADDPHLVLWQELAGSREVLTFSYVGDTSASCYRHLDCDFHFSFHDFDTVYAADLQVGGAHNEHNALAAACLCWHIGVPVELIISGLEEFSGVPGRMEISRLYDTVFINDTYNSSPESFKVALTVLAQRPEPCKILVMADMLELGEQAALLHDEAVAATQALMVDHVLGFGTETTAALTRAGLAGSETFTSKQSLVKRVRKLARGDCVVLIKGSRSMRMDEVVRELANA